MKVGSRTNKALTGRVIASTALLCLAFLVLPAPSAGTTITLKARPTSSWTPSFGEATLPCTPPNPFETSFTNVKTSGGRGVKLETASNTCGCCGCIARLKAFPLSITLNTTTNDVHLKGKWFSTTRGSTDTFSVASIRVDLFFMGSEVVARTFAAENRPNNNCAFDLPEALLTSGAPFDITLSSFAPNIQFDEIRILLQGYGCCTASNSIEITTLKLIYK